MEPKTATTLIFLSQCTSSPQASASLVATWSTTRRPPSRRRHHPCCRCAPGELRLHCRRLCVLYRSPSRAPSAPRSRRHCACPLREAGYDRAWPRPVPGTGHPNTMEYHVASGNPIPSHYSDHICLHSAPPIAIFHSFYLSV